MPLSRLRTAKCHKIEKYLQMFCIWDLEGELIDAISSRFDDICRNTWIGYVYRAITSSGMWDAKKS